MATFDYLLEKIKNAPFEHDPFKHLEIRDFLRPDHFSKITGDAQINLGAVGSTEDLLSKLNSSGYSIIPFPGCVTSEKEYLDWFHGRTKRSYHAATEGFGIVLRLTDFKSSLLKELENFFLSEELKAVLLEKFEIDRHVQIDCGIQKYLHGYEISPHPDIRRKALTWMLNINPGKNAEEADYHTHYMRLKDQWKFISEFWKGNTDLDRDWLPWDWCETVKRQPKNNSIVFFSPSNDTLHAVRADYDHRETQRTQFYGNLWYELNRIPKIEFRYFDVRAQMAAEKGEHALSPPKPSGGLREALKGSLAGQVIRAAKKAVTPEKKSARKVDF